MASFKYPYGILEKDTDWLKVTSHTYNAGSSLKNPSNSVNQVYFTSGATESVVDDFILPIPSNIQDGNSVSYGDDKLNTFTARGVGMAENLINVDAGKLIQGNFGDISLAAQSAGSLIGDLMPIIKKSLAAEAVSIFGGNVSVDQLLARQSGQIMNPNMELLFNGVNLRTFRFSFKMTPRDDTEGENIRGMIKAFKKNMSPIGNTGDDFLSTPNVFKLSYMKGNKPHPFLNRFKDCALTDMSVNYTGENVYATYHDGTPISMVMDLTFKELIPIYQADYADEKAPEDPKYGGVGY